MPVKNAIKIELAKSFYHVYARGVAKQPIFFDDQDYMYFQSLFARYLSSEQRISKSGVLYPNLRNVVQLVAFCLMQNHFHLLLYQIEIQAMSSLMKSVMTSYSKYFNKKYDRTGPVFDSRYKAVCIDSDEYLLHITRYIHMNPRYYSRYKYSSYQQYIRKNSFEWLVTDHINDVLKAVDYKSFCRDYEDRRELLAEIKTQLASK